MALAHTVTWFDYSKCRDKFGNHIIDCEESLTVNGEKWRGAEGPGGIFPDGVIDQYGEEGARALDSLSHSEMQARSADSVQSFYKARPGFIQWPTCQKSRNNWFNSAKKPYPFAVSGRIYICFFFCFDM